MNLEHRKMVVAIHGAGMRDRVWNGLTDIMTEHPPQAISLPGHGDDVSAPLDSIEKMGAWIGLRLKDQPPKSVILMGHSMGALVALEAAKNPAVAGLVLVGAAAEMPVNADLLQEANADPDNAADQVLKWSILRQNPQADALKTWLKKEMSPNILYKDLQACNNYHHGRVAAAAAEIPACVIIGSEDKMVRPKAAEELSTILPQGRFHEIKAAGHMPMVEQPVDMAALLSGFFESLGP